MARSLKKGPYIDPNVTKKIEGKKPSETAPIKTWSRACTITPEMIGFVFGVHNVKDFLQVKVGSIDIAYKFSELVASAKLDEFLKS